MKDKLKSLILGQGSRPTIPLVIIVISIAVFFIVVMVSSALFSYPSVASVIVSAAIFCVMFAAVIVKPLIGIALEMRKVADMDLSVLDKKFQYSRLREIENIQLIFMKLVKNLKEYKAFMPSSLFEKEEEEVDDGEDVDILDGSVTGSSILGSQIQSQPSSGDYSKFDTSKLDKNITYKTGTFVVINCADFNLLMTKVTAMDIIDIHSRYIDIVVSVIKSYRGQVDSFAGDRVFASWNIVKPYKGNHPNAACVAVNQCIEKIAALSDELMRQELPGLSIRAAVTTGSALSGIMGSSSMKIFTSISDHVSMAYKLENHNKRFGTNILITETVLHNIRKTIGSDFRVRLVDVVRLEGRSERERTPVFELLSMKSKLREKWMYEFEQAELNDLYSQYEKGFEAFLHGDIENCRKILREYNRRTFQADPVAEALTKKLEEREAKRFEPYEFVLV